MTPPRPFAMALVRDAALALVQEALVRVLSREDYRSWDPGRTPAGYPALAGEFERWLCGESPGEVVLVPSSWNRLFARVRDLSREVPGSLWVAALEPPGDPLRLKVWKDGDLRLKVGPDPDDEIPYHPLPATPEQVREFLADWAGREHLPVVAPVDPEALALRLGMPRSRPSFADLWRDPTVPGRGSLARWTFIDGRSRLAQDL